MEVISAVISIVLIAILIVAIVKKANILSTLLILSLVAFASATALTGTSTIAEGGSGNMWVDVFESFEDTWVEKLASPGIVIMAVMAYASYMVEIGASDALANALARPLSKLKSKLIIGIIASLLASLMFFAIPSGTPLMAVLLAVFYPILVAAGISPLSAGCILFAGSCLCVGPASPPVLLANSLLGIETPLATFFVQTQFPVAIVLIVVLAIAGPAWNLFCDKRDGFIAKASENAESRAAESAPMYYLVFPLIPLVLIFLMCGAFGNVVIGIVAAHIISLMVVFVVRIATAGKGEKGNVYAELSHFFKGMGDAVSGPVSIVIMGLFFAAGLTALGGLAFLVTSIASSLSMPFEAMLLVVAILFFITSIFAGFAVAIPVFCPVMATVAAATGNMEMLAMTSVILTIGGTLGLFMQPYAPQNLMINAITGDSPMAIVKRMSVPAVCGFVAVFIASSVFIG